ncbi:hypothetical protein [Actinomadura rudentiformis]|uniref:Uncharacterized protein n=1 Tax=Actinomadura rudentiformis TaxID=359158 RepID=A0A6H9YMR8_9ACTN|nr:hypothetical protein [Actinomadura rudentiformis]KAB2347292.1 hypothetical protein F8566_19970 [Actinomadura rudentiformis]
MTLIARVQRWRIQRRLLAAPGLTPGAEAAATRRLIADLRAGVGGATPAPAGDTHTHMSEGRHRP